MKSLDHGEQIELFQSFKPTNLIFFQPKFTFVDLFAGIGGFRIPLEELGGKCLGYSEIDKEAINVYKKNFISYINADELYLGDITALHKLPFEVDILVGGVPCQPWSIAGKLQGLDDPRGKLWIDVFRVVQANKPKGFILENVKGLTEPRNRPSLNYIIQSLTQCGYQVKLQVLNSYDFGLPQDRDRVLIVGIRNDIAKSKSFDFPKHLGKPIKLYDVIDGIERCQFSKKKFPPDILFEGRIPASRGRFQKIDELNDFFIFADIRDGHTTIHSWDLIKTTTRESFAQCSFVKGIYMAAISNTTRSKIKGYLEGFIQGLVNEYKGREIVQPDSASEYLSRRSPKGELKPFQASLIPPKLIRINQFERGLSTRLGNSVEECARIIAQDYYPTAHRGYDITAQVSITAFAEAERQKEHYESAAKGGQAKPSFEEMITAILNARRSDDLEEKQVWADLYY